MYSKAILIRSCVSRPNHLIKQDLRKLREKAIYFPKKAVISVN